MLIGNLRRSLEASGLGFVFLIAFVLLYGKKSDYPDAGYSDRLGPSDKFVEESTKLTCPKTAGYRIKYSTVLWLIELQIWRGVKV